MNPRGQEANSVSGVYGEINLLYLRKSQAKVCVLLLVWLYSWWRNRYLWRWHNSSQDWYLHCQLPFYSQIMKSRLSALDNCLWGPDDEQPSVFSRMILPGQASWHTAPKVIPEPQPGRPHTVMLLSHPTPQCCHTTYSHGKTSPLIFSASLSWISPIRALFMWHHERPSKGWAKAGCGQFSWKGNNDVHITQSATPDLGISP